MPDVDNDFLTQTAGIPETLGGAPATSPTGEVIPPGAAPQTGFELDPELLEETFDFIFGTIADNVGEGGDFWLLREREKRNLARAWKPVLQKLLDAWGVSQNAPLVFAAMMTGMTLVPRLKREKERRASKRVTTQRERSVDSISSPDQPPAESHGKPTESLNDHLVV